MEQEQDRPSEKRVDFARISVLLGALGVLGVIAATLWRVLYSVDFLDESFYAATAYRFALGGRPFVDESDVHQLAGLLVSPYVRLHLAVFGGTTGIVLSLRLLWAALNGIAAFASYRLLRRVVDPSVALLSAAGAFAFIPYLIPAPSYNTLGAGFASIGVSLLGIGLLEHSRWRLAVAGACFSVACFAYPTLVVPSLFALAAAGIFERSWRSSAQLAGGAAIAAIPLVIWISPHLGRLPQLVGALGSQAAYYNWGGSGTGGPLGKLAETLRVELMEALRQPSTYLAGAFAIMTAVRRRVPWWLACLVPASLVLNYAFWPEHQTLAFAISVLIVAALLVLSPDPDQPTERHAGRAVLRIVIGFGLLAALAFAVTSGLGWLFMGFGAAVVFAPALAISLELARASFGDKGRLSAAAAPAATALGLLVVGSLVLHTATASYVDAPAAGLTARIATGPFAGLMTTPERADDLAALESSIARLGGQETRLFAYHGFPAGYLFGGQPAYSQLWPAPGVAPATQKTLSELAAAPPHLVIRNADWPDARTYVRFLDPLNHDAERDAVEQYVRQNYTPVAQGRHWSLLAPTP